VVDAVEVAEGELVAVGLLATEAEAETDAELVRLCVATAELVSVTDGESCHCVCATA
jgi:hypothetical protein